MYGIFFHKYFVFVGVYSLILSLSLSCSICLSHTHTHTTHIFSTLIYPNGVSNGVYKELKDPVERTQTIDINADVANVGDL